jgi:hypothetical protein
MNIAVLRLSNGMISHQADKQEEQSKLLTKQLNHMIEMYGSIKNQGKNFYKLTIKMLLFTLAMDDESVPINLTKSCRLHFKSKMVALAKQKLRLKFENRGMTQVSFPTGYTANM